MRTVLQNWKSLTLAAAAAVFMAVPSQAAMKNVICAKTNTGNYFPVVRISMMVIADGASTFEIVLKDGQGEAGVESITFEKHEEMIDFNLYKTESDGQPYIDLTKTSWLLTSTGKYFKTVDVVSLLAKEGSEKFDVMTKLGMESDVQSVFFFRGDEDGAKEYVNGIDDPVIGAPSVEKLQLMTPIREQMSLSGCGNATTAQVFSLDGKVQAEAAVDGGNTTIYVGQLPAGVYVVRVGNKSLKFTKK